MSDSPEPDPVTTYLRQLEEGDGSAVDRLLPHIYEDLRGLAEGIFKNQAGAHTLQPTALVHEAYMRLVRGSGPGYQGRAHFFKVAAMAMRQLLTDYARGRNAEKRGGGRERVVLEERTDLTDETSGVDLLALDEALDALAALDERQARIVELRFLAGLTIDETAEAIGVSPRTVRLDWQMARKWLSLRLAEDES